MRFELQYSAPLLRYYRHIQLLDCLPLQGDKEAEAGLPVTPFCNRRNVNLPRAQTGFIATFLAPALEALAPLTPDFAATSLALLKETAEGWAAQELDGVLAPGADASKALPTLPVRLTHPPPAAAVES